MYNSMSPSLQHQDLMNFYHSDPIQITNNNTAFDNQLYLEDSHSLPSNEMFPTTNNNDFVSYSPESSSSTETNLVSPPQQYYNSMDYSDFILTPQHKSTTLKRSNSVPRQFHRTTVQHPHFKPLPIQIQKLTKDPALSKANQQKKIPADPETYRRQLDEKLAKVNFDDITVAELKETLRERGLPATGRKAELMNRLKEEYDLVINHNNSHVLNRRIANLSLLEQSPKKSPKQLGYASPKLGYSPYYTPPHRHVTVPQQPIMNEHASSLPNHHSFLNDQFMMNYTQPSTLRESFDPSPSTNKDYQLVNPQPNIEYPPVKLEENVDVWDEQMLQNFLNQI